MLNLLSGSRTKMISASIRKKGQLVASTPLGATHTSLISNDRPKINDNLDDHNRAQLAVETFIRYHVPISPQT